MNNRILITALLIIFMVIIFLGIVFLPKLFNKPVVENIYVNATPPHHFFNILFS